MLYYDEKFSGTHPVSDVMNDECMKSNACMLLIVIWEGCVELCHMNDLKRQV